MATITSEPAASPRRQPAPIDRSVKIGELKIDPYSRLVTVAGEPVQLTKMEYALLRVLASDPERVFTREQLLAHVWGISERLPTRTLDSHAARLRVKLREATGTDRYVINVWGVGYRLTDPPLPDEDGCCPYCGGQLRAA